MATSLCAVSKVLVLDFGSQYSHIIVRRCRDFGLYSELRRGDEVDFDALSMFKPQAIILSGGPYSVYDSAAPHLSSSFWMYLKECPAVPVLGICYGLQELVWQLNGEVERSGQREFGHAEVTIIADPSLPNPNESSGNILFRGIETTDDQHKIAVWMSHGDRVTKLPDGFKTLACTELCEHAVVGCEDRNLWGLQFHPEVVHTACGKQLLSNFLLQIAQCVPSWSMKVFASAEVDILRRTIGKRPVIGAVSGGVDSTVAAALMCQAVGSQFHPFLIDTGLMRHGEAHEVQQRLNRCIPGLNLTCIDASKEFFSALEGIVDPEAKRKIIGRLFIQQFEKAVSQLLPKDSKEKGYLLQGTLYPDVIESVAFHGPSHTIKTHHNVGGLPEKMNLDVIEPLRELFKDEVRELGKTLGLEHASVWRHPFPGPGLGIRILGEVTRERVEILRQADLIFLEEIRKSGDYDQIAQAFCVLLPGARSVGVMGDKRTYEMTLALRAVSSTDFMTADWYVFSPEVLRRCSTRIVNEVEGINRVVYDITSKPPATIEWE